MALKWEFELNHDNWNSREWTLQNHWSSCSSISSQDDKPMRAMAQKDWTSQLQRTPRFAKDGNRYAIFFHLSMIVFVEVMLSIRIQRKLTLPVIEKLMAF